jgi:hypothetical protein
VCAESKQLVTVDEAAASMAGVSDSSVDFGVVETAGGDSYQECSFFPAEIEALCGPYLRHYLVPFLLMIPVPTVLGARLTRAMVIFKFCAMLFGIVVPFRGEAWLQPFVAGG